MLGARFFFSALVRSAKPLCQNVAKRRGVLLRFFCNGYLPRALPLGVEAQLDMLLARETANTLLAGALMGFEWLHVAVEGHDVPNLSGASTRVMVRLAVRFMFPRS